MYTSATLVYTATTIPPVTQARLITAMSNVALYFAAIAQETGCVQVSDTTAASGGTQVTRTIVFALPVPATQQFNGNNVLPANSSTPQYYIVTTSGSYATIGQILYDNGSGTGTVSVVAASTNNYIVPSFTLTGGTVTFTRGYFYSWNGAAWVQGAKSPAQAFQANFKLAASMAKPFNNLYTHTLGGALGAAIVASAPVIA